MKFTQYLAFGYLLALSTLVWFGYGKYQQKAKDYDDLNMKYQTQVIAINQQQARIQHLAELDTKHLEKLANAESKITQLSDDLRTNVKRVYVKGVCAKSETASSPGLDDPRPARLEKDAEQDYVRLLGELETLEAQYLGLRDYVKTECRGNDG
ncbi:lysis protein [Xenorhabdus sp. Vera]|uniref:lysis protein n=1 Tax=Xenorhabdus koppenhoeferi TaxID=351659 RepID=UPI00199FA2F1|nr:lysis protein [Xenorhabdus sp. Vera]MBD2812531.1 lysis protein [Xenorhabdus sp. Vera]